MVELRLLLQLLRLMIQPFRHFDDCTFVAVGNGTAMVGTFTETLPYLSVTAQLGADEALATLRGELDLAGAPSVARMFAESTAAGCCRIVIDVSGLTFIDGAGLRALIAVRDGDADGDGGNPEIVLRSPSRSVRRLLEITHDIGLVERWLQGGNYSTYSSRHGLSTQIKGG
jgi:anti-sigma B factor antagonist